MSFGGRAQKSKSQIGPTGKFKRLPDPLAMVNRRGGSNGSEGKRGGKRERREGKGRERKEGKLRTRKRFSKVGTYRKLLSSPVQIASNIQTSKVCKTPIPRQSPVTNPSPTPFNKTPLRQRPTTTTLPV